MSDSPYGPWEKTDISPSKLKVFMDCPQKYKYQYVDRLKRTTNAAALQGSSLHAIFLEEMLAGGIDDIPMLLDLMGEDLRTRLLNEDPRDYKSGLPLNDAERFDAINDLRVWAEGFLNAYTTGEDTYGNPLKLPDVKETEVEGCVELTLPGFEKSIRLRGYIDLVFEDGSIGDLKLASDYWKAIWTLGKALSEYQPAMYAMMTNSDTFRYLVVDKRKDRRTGAKNPSVRTIEYQVTDKDFKRLLEDLQYFLRTSDLLNEHANGYFPPIPDYNGQTKETAGQPEKQFCGKLCDFKDECYKANYSRGE